MQDTNGNNLTHSKGQIYDVLKWSKNGRRIELALIPNPIKSFVLTNQRS
jgi:hypothetical protein